MDQPRHLSPWIAWSLIALFAGISLFATWYYYSEVSTAYDNSVTFFGLNLHHKKAVTSPTTTATSTTTDPTSSWKTYTDASYGLSFKYPANWPEPKLTVQKSTDDALVAMNMDIVNFNASNASVNWNEVNLTNISDYNALNSAQINTEIQSLNQVYTQKSVSGIDKVWLPPSNASIAAHNSLTYIETNDGKYRGMMYFAMIGQDYGTDLTNIIELTNGSKIIQLSFRRASALENQYKNAPVSDFTNKYYPYVATITTATTTEPIVQEYNSTFQYMAKSLTNL